LENNLGFYYRDSGKKKQFFSDDFSSSILLVDNIQMRGIEKTPDVILFYMPHLLGMQSGLLVKCQPRI
jgi:hypothetical protein